jgi:hypothetical protein
VGNWSIVGWAQRPLGNLPRRTSSTDQRRTTKGLGMTAVKDRRQDRRRSTRCRTVVWIVGLATVGLMFDGYDLVVYGAVVSILRRSPAEIGPVTPAVAGALASYAILLLGSAGWHGMFWTGALPVVTWRT